ncbi:MAG: polymer-forming cytoskeletal protein [Tepidisphaerales bacterium]
MRKQIKSSSLDLRTIVCIYCRKSQPVGTQTLSIPCRFCQKNLVVEDITISGYAARRVIETCGTVIIEAKGDVTANCVTCAALRLNGRLKADVVSLGPVTIAASGILQGNITAPFLSVAEGARLRGRCAIGGKP